MVIHIAHSTCIAHSVSISVFYNYGNHKISFAAQHLSSKQSSGGGAAVPQPGTSQVSASVGSAGDRILGMLKINLDDTDR